MNDRCPCGGIILADTEDWETPVCDECYTPLTRLDIPKLQKENARLREAIRVALWTDRSRGYPTGHEWMQLVRGFNAALEGK